MMRGIRFSLALAVVAAFLLGVAAAGAPCDTPGAVLPLQMEAVSAGEASSTLTWPPAAGAGTYDVYLGPFDPHNLHAEGLTATSLVVNGLADGTTYYWYVVAHAECDPTLTSRTVTSQFTTPGACPAVGGFSLSSPAAGAGEVANLVEFRWVPAPGAASYDLYLGRTESPVLVLSGIVGTSIDIPRLLPSTKYFWRVVARSGCNPSASASTPVSSFTVTTSCPAPEATSISFAPTGDLSVGQTYAIAWEPSEGIDAGGSYIVERSTSATFANVVDRQQTTATSASFVSSSTGTLHHRVRAIAGCSATKTSAWSPGASVSVKAGRATVVITRPPDPVITRLGDLLEDQRASFVIENIGTENVQVAVTRQEVGSVPFFQIIDPFGGSSFQVTLKPREPKTMDLRFSGPANDTAGSYQGVITVTPLVPNAAVSYAWVNLKVGDTGATAAPKFLVGGLESEYAFFPPKKGDDSDRAPLSVDILNSGTAAMDLTSEVGPEMWLQPESGWNKTPIPANSFRPVRLSTIRFLAPGNSALPRYTYFTVRNRSGQSARLLVQDNTEFEKGTGRASLSSLSDRSFIVPTVTTESLAGGGQRFTRLSLANVGGSSVQADLYYVATGQDGYDDAVRRATVVLPPNDVVNITDPLVQVFGLTRPASGQLEIRSAPEKIGLIAVEASTETRPVGGGAFRQSLPTIQRGEGAVVGASHVVAGIVRDGSVIPDMVLVETTGRDAASVRVRLRDSSGAVRGERVIAVPRYGRIVTPDIVQTLGGSVSGSGFRIDLTTESGGGAVVGVVSSSVAGNRGGSALVSVPVAGTPAVSTLGRFPDEDASAALRYVVPGVLAGVEALPGAGMLRTELTLLNTGEQTAGFTLTFNDEASGNSSPKTVSVPAGATVSYASVLAELWGASPARGSLTIDAPAEGRVFASLRGDLNAGPVLERMPVISALSESLTGSGSRKPLYADAIEQSTSDSRGSRASLVLAETSGRTATVRVRLYEAGNRVFPVAEKAVSVPAGGQVTLDPFFDALGMNDADRRKNRTNMQLVVVPDSAAGLVAAVLRTTDNLTGAATLHLLQPAGGVPATGIQTVSVQEPVGGRRRPVRR